MDSDEFDHLPDVAYIPIEGVDAAEQQAVVRLCELARGGTALVVYSSRDRLIAAQGEDQPAMTLPARELPTLQRQLGFNAVLLDVALPLDSRRRVSQVGDDRMRAMPLDVDQETGEPLVYVPSLPYRTGDARAQLELQPLVNGEVAILTYPSKQSLLDGCGPEQHYVYFPVTVLSEVMRQCRANRVLIDTPLPAHLRH